MKKKVPVWGFSTIGCPELTLSEAAALGERTGFPMLEVRIASPETMDCMTLRTLAGAGRCRILGSSFGIASDDDEARRTLAAGLKLAAGCRVPFLRCFGGFPFTEKMDPRKLDAIRKNLDFAASLELPVRIALETHDGFSAAARMAELFDRLGKTLPVIWDSFHTFFKGKESPEYSWKLLKENVIDVHLKDGSEKVFTLPGQGSYPLAELLEMLKLDHYAGLLTCEHEKMWHPDLPLLAEALKKLKPFQNAFGEIDENDDK